MQRARLQARLGSRASREEKSAELDELTVPQLTALCGRYGLDRNGAKADMVSQWAVRRACACALVRQSRERDEVDSRSCAAALKVPELKAAVRPARRAQDNSARRRSR